MLWKIKYRLQNNMRNIFIKLAGADFDILDKCVKTNQTQRIKLAGFGMLLLIPAIVGLFSMMYALSTLTSNPYIYIMGGIVWSFIVLIIDRFIVATFFKSKVEGNPILSIFLRLLFAILVGTSVAHPVTLLWFHEIIEHRLDEQKRDAIKKRREQALEQIKQIPKGSASQKIDAKTERRDCLVNLLTLEQSGVKKETPCGASSGIKDCGERCKNIGNEIAQLKEELGELSTQANEEFLQEADVKNKIETDTDNDIKELERKFPKDYTARYDALIEIEREKPHIEKVEWFILLFFIFLDSLVVLIKLVTPVGEYEFIRDKLLFDAKKAQKAERAAIKAHAKSILPATLEAKRKYDSKEDELTHLTDTTRQFLTEQEKIRIRTDKQFQEIGKRVKLIEDDELRGFYLEYLRRSQTTFDLAWSKAHERFNDFLNEL